MPIYRLHEALMVGEDTRLPMDSTNSLKRLSPEVIDMLLDKKRISIVQAPPLAVLPGWEEKAEAYAKKGIFDLNDLADAKDVPEEDVKEALKWSEPGYESDGWMSTPIGEVDEDELVE